MRNDKENKFIGAIKKFDNVLTRALCPEGYVCIGCGSELKEADHPKSICSDCAQKLHYHDAENTCAICGDRLKSGTLCERCDSLPPNFDKAYAVFDYTDLASKLIINHKDNEKPFLAKYIAGYLLEYYSELNLSVDTLCYVPTDQKTFIRRGYDHMLNVAKHFSEQSGLQITEALIRIKHAGDQSRLGHDKRFASVKGAFALSPKLASDALNNKKVLLLDDVLTTGATASECAKVLKSGGAKSVTVLTFARK